MLNQNMICDITKSSYGAKNTQSNTTAPAAKPKALRNLGRFRPDARVDTAKALADNIGDSPEEEAHVKKLYAATKNFYEKEAAAKGWKNNIAGGPTFFTATAMTVYRDDGEPSAAAANIYFKSVSGALDQMPEMANATNRDKQALNNVPIGFSGILLAAYSEGKQKNAAATLAKSKKLAGMLIEMVLKTKPENITIKNNRIPVKL